MAYTILIVDDSATTRAIIKRTITLCGVETNALLEAPDGQAALTLLRQRPVDLVMLDINMPHMNGLQVTREIRADLKLRSLKVVIVSSESTAARIEQLRNEGADGYVKKPFTPEQIRSVLTTVLGVAHAA